ncbi:hypothetical protein NMG60_11002203 [Bertholletia excelsa]
MKPLSNPLIFLCLLPFLLRLQFLVVESKPVPNRVHQNATISARQATSPWLRRVVGTAGGGADPREPGCWKRPWICSQRELPPWSRRMCCRNRCVDAASDVNNCGLCGIRCPFTWKCCVGFCINTNISPFHCGTCSHRCPIMSPCIYGMCGYGASPLPPFPFPPRPPFPFPFPTLPPHPPKPARPPKPPFPPHPPTPPHGTFPPHPPYGPERPPPPDRPEDGGGHGGSQPHSSG